MISTGISNNFSSTAISQHSYGYSQDEKLNAEPQKTDETKSNKVDKNNDETKSSKVDKNNKGKSLSDEELKEVESLKKRNAEVIAHEQAHAATGGQYAGSASFDYQTGPDGVRYAVGGEVPIDVSEIPDDPEATATKMEIVQNAALAPVSPSAADRAIASSASMKEMEARGEIASGKLDNQGKPETGKSGQQSYSESSEKGENLDIKI